MRRILIFTAIVTAMTHVWNFGAGSPLFNLLAQASTYTTTTLAELPEISGCAVARDAAATECAKSSLQSEADQGPDSSIHTDAPTSSTPSSEKKFVAYERIVDGGGPNGEACKTTGYREVPVGVDPGIVGALSDRDFRDIRLTYPQCPAQPGSDFQPATSANYAARYWKVIPLPAPQPHIAPGRAITGMYAYMETRGSTTHTFNEPNTPFGALTIVATGKYYVDWGDGTTTGPHSREGKPWPDGEIKHQYINIGSYDVVVTERWTATWTFGSESGTLDELRTVGRIEDFPVGQIQAVVYQ